MPVGNFNSPLAFNLNDRNISSSVNSLNPCSKIKTTISSDITSANPSVCGSLQPQIAAPFKSILSVATLTSFSSSWQKDNPISLFSIILFSTSVSFIGRLFKSVKKYFFSLCVKIDERLCI